MKEKFSVLVQRNLLNENQVIRQILGICSALAVTNLLLNTFIMSMGVTFTLALSSFTISLLRNYIPSRVRMIIQTLIIAAYVIFVDIFIKATLPEVSKALGPYVGLIITNCIIMGRAEAFAQKNTPFISMLDGIFAGLGYSIVLLMVAVIRETLGFGTFFGIPIFGENFDAWIIMVMPPSAFFIIGLMIWAVSYRISTRAAVAKK